MTVPFRVFIYGLSTVFWLGVAVALALGHGDLPGLRELAPLFAFAVAAEALTVGQDERAGILSFSAAAHIAVAIVFGPVPAALVAGAAVIVVDGVQLTAVRHVVVNSAMFGVSIWVAAEAYVLAGGSVAVSYTHLTLPTN